jgi:hypothetical protein
VLVYALYRVETGVSETKMTTAETQAIARETRLAAKEARRLVALENEKQEAQIASLNFVLNEQAIPAVVDLLAILEANGIKPPRVLLGPSQPPYEPQNP